ELGTPRIYEEGPQIRPWRLILPKPQPLETEDGALTALWIHEISFKGVLLEQRRPGDFPQRFSAWFAPDDYEPIPLRGRFERLTENGRTA
ncbi:hypothetical protein, partial [Pandoraea sputorum]|uniref:hypothetical protein n=1 Tax=Pandoraea sputorum TaxID=93222 RepID=UPI003556536B